MGRPIEFIFQFGDGGTHNASVTEKSAGINFCDDYGWFINPVSSGLDAAPTYTIEVSHEDVDASYVAYEDAVVDAPITQPFDDTHLVQTWMRINYDAVANTTGTVSFPLTLKR